MKLTIKDLNPHNYKTDAEQDANLTILCERVNKLQEAYGKQFTITSGLRSAADQARINPSAPKSKHLLGAACDIYDPKGELKVFILKNTPIDLWFEDFGSTRNWVHAQILPPKSGNRFFIP